VASTSLVQGSTLILLKVLISSEKKQPFGTARAKKLMRLRRGPTESSL
jgi:hypothetical protein